MLCNISVLILKILKYQFNSINHLQLWLYTVTTNYLWQYDCTTCLYRVKNEKKTQNT